MNLIAQDWTGASAELARWADDVQGFAAGAKSEATRTAYATDWATFKAWCSVASAPALPATPAALAAYVAHLVQRGRKTSTISRALTSISQAHKIAGHASPTADPRFCEVMKGVRRKLGVATTQKVPVLVEDVRAMVRALDDDLRGSRDRALLLLGFAGGFRRSELVGLDVTDIAFHQEGLTVSVKRSKTDQEGMGHRVGVCRGRYAETCPVLTVDEWLKVSAIENGPVFRGIDRAGKLSERSLSSESVALVVKRAAKRVGLDPKKVAGHSLRAGFATQAAKNGAAERRIMAQTGHRSLAVVRRYIREGTLFEDNASSRLGL